MDYGQDTGVCPWCGAALERSKSNFNKGKFKRCQPCYNKQHLRRWYGANRDRELAKAKNYYRKTRKRRREVSRENYWNMAPEARNRRNRNMALKQKYRITLEQYEAMVAEQKGLCFLCSHPPRANERLAVDHCHRDKAIRKLLCKTCNFFLGVVERDPDWLSRALEYLKAA